MGEGSGDPCPEGERRRGCARDVRRKLRVCPSAPGLSQAAESAGNQMQGVCPRIPFCLHPLQLPGSQEDSGD